jgi:hypothetical protein
MLVSAVVAVAITRAFAVASSGTLGKPDRIRYELLPVSETHFLMPSNDPLEDTQTVAIYDFERGRARYLHTNCPVNPRGLDAPSSAD